MTRLRLFWSKIIELLNLPFLSSTVGEILAVGLALAYLVSAIRRSLICWFFAGISSILYLIIMLQAHLYMQTFLQFFYLIMAFYGWYEWKTHQKTNEENIIVVSWSLKKHLMSILVIVLLTAINGFFLKTIDQAEAPYLDAFITWGSILTTWMVAQRVLENWIYWFFIDLLAAYLYYTQELTITALLFVLYTLMVIYGYIHWKR